jgi:beta-lactamase regulating signal transducer with metallopeptidase domain
MRVRGISEKLNQNSWLWFSVILALGFLSAIVLGVFATTWIDCLRSCFNIGHKHCTFVKLLTGSWRVSYSILILAFLSVGLVFSIVKGLRRLMLTRSMMARAEPVSLQRFPRLKSAIEKSLGSSEDVMLVRSPAPICFTKGFLHPRIILSTQMGKELTSEELEAVLLHEASHLRRRDPLRRLVAELIQDFLFFIPFVRIVGSKFRASQEITADRYVTSVTDRPVELARAIVKVASNIQANLVVPFSSQETLNDRVRRLVGLPKRPKGRLRVFSVILSLALMITVYLLPLAVGYAAEREIRRSDACNFCSTHTTTITRVATISNSSMKGAAPNYICNLGQ